MLDPARQRIDQAAHPLSRGLGAEALAYLEKPFTQQDWVFTRGGNQAEVATDLLKDDNQD